MKFIFLPLRAAWMIFEARRMIGRETGHKAVVLRDPILGHGVLGIGFTKAHKLGTTDEIQVQPDSIKNYRALIKLLAKINMDHVFQLPSEKPLRLVIRHLPTILTPKAFKNKRGKKSYPVISMCCLKKGKERNALPLVYIQARKSG